MQGIFDPRFRNHKWNLPQMWSLRGWNNEKHVD